jgi:hypothetical protein
VCARVDKPASGAVVARLEPIRRRRFAEECLGKFGGEVRLSEARRSDEQISVREAAAVRGAGEPGDQIVPAFHLLPGQFKPHLARA